MLRDDFVASDEWQTMSQVMLKWHEENVLALRGAGDIATAKYYQGILDAIDAFLLLPEKTLSNGEPKQKAPEDVLDLPNHPRPSRNTYV